MTNPLDDSALPNPTNLQQALDAFEWFINGQGSTRPDAERGALISLGLIVAEIMEAIGLLHKRVAAIEQDNAS